MDTLNLICKTYRPEILRTWGYFAALVARLDNLIDAEEMAGRIEELLDDEELKERMGRAGRKRIEDEFSMNKVTAEYVAMYRNLAD